MSDTNEKDTAEHTEEEHEYSYSEDEEEELHHEVPADEEHCAVGGRKLQKHILQSFQRREEGGFKWLDEEGLAKQRGVAWETAKQIGQNFLDGKDLVSVVLPVYLFEPRSFLQRLAHSFSYVPHFFSKAAATSNPVERMKFVICCLVGGLHLSATQKKPFNPILGETYQGVFEDGTLVYCEQTTHHPPASNFQVIPTDRSYHFHGHGIFSAIFLGNSIKGYQEGPNIIDFHDGTRITVTLPNAYFRGMLWGERVQDFIGNIVFEDKKNNLTCSLEFNPEAPSWLGSWFTAPKYPTDYVMGDIKCSKTDKLLSHVEGSWLSHLEFDKKRYWDLYKTEIHLLRPVKTSLPSDCRNRSDLIALAREDFDGAVSNKLHLEQKQRKEARLRKEGRS
eukprot:CAMPEP_0174252632 /NCGR_PEP_ID=MMETSP0439-20130205/2020_1 /TAXON_ID=0 /ORGANISM="Stereomyxa ramosa, Strain Chinc5" /LENGTH=390 /DNA_ID=CAMNT_0015333195 /DNA_START=14 /DNA_END=1186 /DNA_ORIENTATION=+